MSDKTFAENKEWAEKMGLKLEERPDHTLDAKITYPDGGCTHIQKEGVGTLLVGYHHALRVNKKEMGAPLKEKYDKAVSLLKEAENEAERLEETLYTIIDMPPSRVPKSYQGDPEAAINWFRAFVKRRHPELMEGVYGFWTRQLEEKRDYDQ